MHKSNLNTIIILYCDTAKVVITANATPLNGKVLKLKESLEGVLSKSTVEHVLVFKRIELHDEAPMTTGRDEWLEEVSLKIKF